VLGPGHVAGHEHGASAGLLDQPRGVLGVLVLVEIGDEDVGPLAGVGDGHGTADAAVAAGDDGRLALESAGAPVAVLSAVRSRGHLRLDAGDVLLLGWLAHAAPLSLDRFGHRLTGGDRENQADVGPSAGRLRPSRGNIGRRRARI
jgi:hypothetical protein